MAGPTVECYNCGSANPSWAQVCRSCGVPIRPSGTRPEGALPTDQDSLISMGTGIGAILLAVVLGLFLSGLVPPAPAVQLEPSPTPVPSRSPRASPSPDESVTPSDAASGDASPQPLGTLTFGTGIDPDTKQATNVTDAFGPGSTFAHSLELPEPFGVDEITQVIGRVEEDGTETEVQSRENGALAADPDASAVGFSVPTDNLLRAWGPGTYVMRDYRGEELLGEGTFTLTN